MFTIVEDRKINVEHTAGSKGHIFYCAGHRNDMQTPTGLLLKDFCVENDIALTRFDYSGWGESDGERGQESRLIQWRNEARAVFDEYVKSGQQVTIVGFSMGIFLAFDLALEHPNRVKNIIGISAGLGEGCFTKFVAHYGTQSLSERISLEKTENGVHFAHSVELPAPTHFIHFKDDSRVTLNSVQENSARITSQTTLRVIDAEAHSPKTPEAFAPFAEEILKAVI